MDATISLLLVPFVILGGGLEGTNDLVDYAQPQAYWKAQGANISDDALIGRLQVGKVGDISVLIRNLGEDDFTTRETSAQAIIKKGAGAIPQLKKHIADKNIEIASRVAKLITELEVSDIDRLIAMRVLGERKSKAAIPQLKLLLESKELFVAEHAKRAIAMIEGTAYKPPSIDPALLEKDLWLLPAGSKIVAQTNFRGGRPYDVENLYKELPILNQAGQEKGKWQKKLHETVTTYAKMLGNIRIDAVTIGTNGEFNEDKLTAVAVFRGLYSRAKMKAITGKQPGVTVRTVDGIDVIEHEFGALLLPSNEVIVVIVGDKSVRQAMLKSVKQGVGSLRDDNEMATLIKSVNRKFGGWAAVRLNDKMKSQYWLAPYETMTAHRTVGEDDRPTIHITCVGKDAAAVKKTSMRFAADMKAAEQIALQAFQQGQLPKSALDLVQSVKVDINGATARVSFHSPKELDTVMTSVAFFPVFALLAGDDLLDF